MRARTLTLLALLLGGCVSAPPGTPLLTKRVGESPELGVVTQRAVGEVIYETFNYEEWHGARLAQQLNISVFAASAVVEPSDPLIAVVEAGETVYCTATPVLRVTGQPPLSRVCLADRDGDSAFDNWRAPEGPPIRFKWAPLKGPAPFSTEKAIERSGKGFKYELLYQGIAAGVVSLLYREYVDDLVRPAFQQDLSYTLSPEGPTEISFRGTRIVIEAADNKGIRYRVLTGLLPRP